MRVSEDKQELRALVGEASRVVSKDISEDGIAEYLLKRPLERGKIILKCIEPLAQKVELIPY